MKLVPRRRAGSAKFNGRRPRRVVESGRHPISDIRARIEAYVALGQTEIRPFAGRRSVGRMNQGLPARIRTNNRVAGAEIEKKSGPAAVLVTETFLAPEPPKHGNRVLPFLQPGRQIHLVVVSVLRIRPAFQSAFKYRLLAVDPKPVLRVHCDPRHGGFRNGADHEVLAKNAPCVFNAVGGRADPLGMPFRRTRPGPGGGKA